MSLQHLLRNKLLKKAPLCLWLTGVVCALWRIFVCVSFSVFPVFLFSKVSVALRKFANKALKTLKLTSQEINLGQKAYFLITQFCKFTILQLHKVAKSLNKCNLKRWKVFLCVFKPPPVCQRSCWSNGRRARAAVAAATLLWNSRWLCSGRSIVNTLRARTAAFSIIRAVKVPRLSHWPLWAPGRHRLVPALALPLLPESKLDCYVAASLTGTLF